MNILGSNSDKKERLKDVIELINYLKDQKLSMICSRSNEIEIWKEGKCIYKRYMLNMGETL